MSDSPDPDKMVELARELADQHHMFEEAAEVLGWAAALDPLEDTQKLRARLLAKLGRHDEAKEILDGLPESDDPDELNDRAIAAAGCLDYGGAAATLTRAMERAPDKVHLWANRGLFRFCAGDYDEAASDLVRAALVQVGGNPGELRDGRRHPELADLTPLFRSFDRIREEDGRSNRALAIIEIWVLVMNNDQVRARRALGRLPREERESWRPLSLRAALVRYGHQSSGTRRKLEGLYNAALDRNPDDVALLVALYHVCRRTALLDAILRMAPRWTKGWEDGARNSLALDPATSLAHSERALELEPESFHALHVKATAQGMLGDLEAALITLDTLVDTYGLDDTDDELDRDSEDVRGDVLCDRAHLKYKLRDLPGARRDYDLAARPETYGWHPFLRRGRFFAYQRLWAEALEDLDGVWSRMRGTDPEDPQARDSWLHKLRARLRERTGDVAGAREDRERAARMDRKHEAAIRADARKRKRKAAKSKRGR